MALSMRVVERSCVLNLLRTRLLFAQTQYRHGHKETTKFPDEHLPLPKGKKFDKKPFRMELTAGRKYHWCVCGHSHTQPMCDGTHKTLWGTAYRKTMPKWRSFTFTVDETKEYWLCNCKQTDNRPFCDGTHKQPEIQSVVKF